MHAQVNPDFSLPFEARHSELSINWTYAAFGPSLAFPAGIVEKADSVRLSGRAAGEGLTQC